MKKIAREGERLPTGYGVAYVEWDVRRTVIYPLGIHMIVRWHRDLMFWLRWYGMGPSYRDKMLRAHHPATLKYERQRAYERGFYVAVEEMFRYAAEVRDGKSPPVPAPGAFE